LAKRSVTIARHRTSVSVEEPFWQAIGDMATARGTTLAALIAEIDRTRPANVSLSSAIRIAALEWYRGASTG
jgi:predicted DNA-binding ribbon-helix-helix protein